MLAVLSAGWIALSGAAPASAAVQQPVTPDTAFVVSEPGSPFANIDVSEDGASPAEAFDLALSPDETALYASVDDAVVKIDTATQSVVARVVLASSDLRLLMDPSGEMLYAFSGDAFFRIPLADFGQGVETLALPPRFGVSGFPTAQTLAISPDGDRIYLANGYQNSVPPYDEDSFAYVLDSSDGSVLHRFDPGAPSGIPGLDWHGDASSLVLDAERGVLYVLGAVSGDADGETGIVAYDATSYAELWRMPLLYTPDPENDPEEVRGFQSIGVSISRDGSRLYLGSDGSSSGAVYVVELDSIDPVTDLPRGRVVRLPEGLSFTPSIGRFAEFPGGCLLGTHTPYYSGFSKYCIGDGDEIEVAQLHNTDDDGRFVWSSVMTRDGSTVYLVGWADGVKRVMTAPAVQGCTPDAASVEPFSLGVQATRELSVIGSTPMTFALDPASAPLPDGLSLGSDGTISGTAAETGDFAYRVTVENPTGSASFDCRLSVLASSAGGEPGTDEDRVDSDRPSGTGGASDGTGGGSELSATGGGSQAGAAGLAALLVATGAGAWALGAARLRARRRAV